MCDLNYRLVSLFIINFSNSLISFPKFEDHILTKMISIFLMVFYHIHNY